MLELLELAVGRACSSSTSGRRSRRGLQGRHGVVGRSPQAWQSSLRGHGEPLAVDRVELAFTFNACPRTLAAIASAKGAGSRSSTLSA
jgi:hypothetical protein